MVISADTSGPCLPRRATAATSGTLGTHAPHVLIPAGDEHKTFNTSKLFAAVYPEAVDLARIIASPFWRRLAGGSPEERRRFDREVARRVTYPYREDSGTGDAIGHWALADSWRPLVQPLLTHTPAHGTGILSPLHGSRINRHEKSALWFGKNRQAGSTLLHHGHVKAAVLRPWRPDYEQLMGSISHSTRVDSKMQDLVARERVAEGNT